MAKKLMSFRFSDASQERLAALSVEWGVTATAVLERLLLGRDPLPVDAIGPSLGGPGTLAEGRVSPKVVEVAKPRVKFRSQVADPDKLAAFQRGMGKKK